LKEQWRYPDPQRHKTPYIHYQDLDRTNAGLQAEKWQNKTYQTWNLNHDLVVGMIGDRLNMTQRQKSKAHSILSRFDLSKWGVRREWVALGACGYVLHNDGSRKCHPNSLNRDQLFLDTCADYDTRMKMVDRQYNKIANELRKGTNEPQQNFGKREYRAGEYVNQYDLLKDETLPTA
jgi:hypothetical protein